MKNSKSPIILALLFVFAAFGCDKEEKISESELPTGITTYLGTHFSTCNVVTAIKDDEIIDLTYDITLDCGVQIEFDDASQATDIDGGNKIPDSVVPKSILQYTSTQYPAAHVVGWELDGNTQQVELSNSIELDFDSDGEFLRIDD